MDKVLLQLDVTDSFLDGVLKKFHFAFDDRESFHQVGRTVAEAMRGQAGFWCCDYALQADPDALRLFLVALTLGSGVDALQERYAEQGRLTECYMAETIADELLMAAYRHFNRWTQQNAGYHVARYHFYGADSAYPLKKMGEALAALEQTEITCNPFGCLSPKKSVVFLAELTKEEGVRCEGVCRGCKRTDCPNRYGEKDEKERLRWPDLTEWALPYGYARILGKWDNT